jgi:hypothetical protein
MPNDSLTLSRQGLYELVWSKPMSELAKDFGLSDVGLAKRCRRLCVPFPGRGYWARIAAGQTPHRPELPEREETYVDHRARTFAPPSDSTPDPENLLPPEEAAMRTKIDALNIAQSTNLSSALPAVKRTARHHKHPRRAELTFARGEAAGPLVRLDVSGAVLDRALLLADTFLKTVNTLGWNFVAAPPPKTEPDADRYRYGTPPEPPPKPAPVCGQLLVEGEGISFLIEERQDKTPHSPTPQERAKKERNPWFRMPTVDYYRTGKLRFVRIDSETTYRTRRESWYDRKGKRVEDQLKDILNGFLDLSLAIKAKRADDERERHEREEQERQRVAAEERREGQKKLIETLERQAGAWLRATQLRRYLRAFRRAAGTKTITAKLREDTVDFLAWADSFVNQLDPLHTAPREPDMKPEPSYHYRSDEEELRESLSRLTGLTWHQSFKIMAKKTTIELTAEDE